MNPSLMCFFIILIYCSLSDLKYIIRKKNVWNVTLNDAKCKEIFFEGVGVPPIMVQNLEKFLDGGEEKNSLKKKKILLKFGKKMFSLFEKGVLNLWIWFYALPPHPFLPPSPFGTMCLFWSFFIKAFLTYRACSW